MADVFLSYKAEDGWRLMPLVRALEADGLSVWWDERIGGGEAWRETIQAELDTARCVLVAWSKRSVGPEGRFVRDEASRAQRRGVYLPIEIDRVQPPLGFGETQALPMVGWHGKKKDPRYRQLHAAIQAVINGKPAPTPLPRATTVGLSRRGAIGAGAAIAAAAGGGWLLLKPKSAGATNSIAVLPFANLSGDPSEAYFADGIAEELRNALSRLDGLKVAGRISSEALRQNDAASISRKLKVATILTGSVRKAPGMIRISSQLIDGRTGLERWSASYDRPEGNALTVQSEIAQSVVNALSLELGDGSREALLAGTARDPQAYDLYLRAVNQARSDDSETSLGRAIAMLDQAIGRDPRFAEAYAARSHNRSYLADVGRTPAETAAGYEAAVRDARQALEIAPRLGTAHAALADALYGQRKIAATIRQVDAGLRFAPNDLDLLQAAVVALVADGKPPRALQLANRMVDLDPLNPLSHRRRYYALFYGRRYSECIEEAGRTLELAPTLALPSYFTALSLIMLGRPEEAQTHLEKLPSDLTVRLAGEAIVAFLGGRRAQSDRKLAELGKLYGDAASYQFAQVYAQRGERDRAIAALQKGFAVNDPGLNTMAVDPLLDPLRKDGRFDSLRKRLDASG